MKNLKLIFLLFLFIFLVQFNNQFAKAQDYGKAVQYFKSGQFRKASVEFEKSLPLIKQEQGEGKKYAITLIYTALSFQNTFKYTKAENYYLQSLDVFKNINYQQDPWYATSCSNLAGLYEKVGKYQKAKPLYFKAKAIYENSSGKESKSYAKVCNNIGGLYIRLGELEKAEPYLIEAKEIGEKLFGKEHDAYAMSCNNLAELYRNMRNYKKAIPLYTEARLVYEKLYGKQHLQYAITCNNLALLYTKTGDYESAEANYLESNAVFKKVYGENNDVYAQSVNNLAGLYLDFGKYQKAELLFIEAKEIRAKILGKQHPDYAGSCNNLAGLYRRTGEYRKAELLLIESKNIYEKALGKNHPNYALACNNLASIYSKAGLYKNAEPLLLEAKSISEAIDGRNNKTYANSCNNLATLYVKTGNYQKAESLLIESKAIYERLYGKNDVSYAKTCNNLAAVYHNIAILAESSTEGAEALKNAVSLTIEAKSFYKKLYGKEHSSYALSCVNLASLYSTIGNSTPNYKKRIDDYKKAAQLYSEAKKIYEKLFGKSHPLYATTCEHLGTLYKNIANSVPISKEKTSAFNSAEQLFIEAKDVRAKILGKQHPDYLASCNNLALLYQNMGAVSGNLKDRELYEKAEQLYIEANEIQVFLSVESAKFMSQKEREKYLSRKLNNSFEIYHSFFLTKCENNEKLNGIVYNNALNIKGQLLKSSVSTRKAVLKSGDTLLINKYKKMNYIGKILVKQYTLPVNEHRADIKQLEEEVNTLEKELTRIIADLQVAKNLQSLEDLVGLDIKWADIKKSLKKDETTIEFIRFNYYNGYEWTDSTLYYALVLRKDYVYPKAVFLFEEKQLQKLLERSKNEDDFNYVRKLYSYNSRQSNRLYQLVFKPVEQYLKDTKTIYMSPSGLLNRIAFDALNSDSLKILSDKYNIFYTSSTATSINKDKLLSTDIENVALFGGIEYSIEPNKMRTNAHVSKEKIVPESSMPIEPSSPANSLERGMLDGLTRNVSWSYLSGSLKETEEIVDIVKRKRIGVKLYKEEQGSEEQFKALENDAPSIIHVSTHGFYFGNDKKSMEYKNMIDKKVEFAHSDNPLLRSGFILAGGNAAFQAKTIPEGVEDGILTAAEISSLNFFNTKLAVLSACQTGLGDVKGSEGVYGLQRAFKMAGVEYLLFSLWEVPDYQTRELMTNFYQNWFTGIEIRVAFKKAQDQLKTKYAKVDGAAFAWAAFVLMR